MHDSHNTHRWIRFGTLSFQPSEIAKPALVLFLAWFLQNRMHLMEDWRRTLIPAALPSLIFIALILKEPDLGTALVCAGVTALMLWLAGMQHEVSGLRGARGLAHPLLHAVLGEVAARPHARVPESLNQTRWAKASTSSSRSSRWAQGDSAAWATWMAGRSSFICPSRTPTTSSRTFPRNWD